MQDHTNDGTAAAPETISMTVWPSIAAFSLGRQIGQLCGLTAGAGKFFTVGKLLSLATIPLSVALFFWRLAPGVARRYTLTDQRVVIRTGLGGADGKSISLRDFDSIDVEVLAGQAFLRAGDLVFRSAGKDIFRLPGIQHPEAFRQACLRGQQALTAVSQAVADQRQRQEAAAATGN